MRNPTDTPDSLELLAMGDTLSDYLCDRRLATRGQARREVCAVALKVAEVFDGTLPGFSSEGFLAIVGNGEAYRVREGAERDA